MTLRTKEKTIGKETKKILKGLQGKKVGVFVDDANLYRAYKNQSPALRRGSVAALTILK